MPTKPWWIFVVPLAAFLVLSSLEPKADATDRSAPAPQGIGAWFASYPLIYTAKSAIVAAIVLSGMPSWREFKLLPIRCGWLAIAVGIAGLSVWIVLAELQRQLGWTSTLGQRSGFDPWQQIASPVARCGFLLVRFFGLVALVPVIEEFFLRGFLMRYFVEPDFWQVRFGEFNGLALLAGTLTPVLTHPNEAVAALVWFSAVTWLMIRTGRLWDCVAAHVVTNLGLGLYVLATGSWYLM